MTKFTPEDHRQALLCTALALRDRLNTVAHTPFTSPEDWQAETPHLRGMLEAIDLLAAHWQETIDHEAELDRQAELEATEEPHV